MKKSRAIVLGIDFYNQCKNKGVSMKTDRSAEYFSKAKEVIPGGVNSPVRACKSVGCDPLFVQKASGTTITDVDGNQFIDFVSS